MQNLETKDKKSKNTLRQALGQAYNELEKRVEERTAYLMMTNKNLQKEIAERIRAEGLLHYRIEFEKLITTLSSDFIKLSSNEVPSAIRSSLQTIGEFVGVDCSFVFLFSDDGARIQEIYKWCKKGIRFPLQNLKGCLIEEEFPWLLEKIKRHKVFHVSCSDELPPEAWKEKKYFRTLKIQSGIIIPMFFGTSFIGFVGFNSIWTKKTWEVDILELLRIIGEIFANAIECKKMEDTHRKSENRYQLLFEYTSDGTAILDKDANISDCNTAYTKLLGFSREEIIGKQASNFYKDTYKKQFARVLQGDQIDSEVKILGRDSNTPLPFFCRLKTIFDENDNFTVSLIQCRNIVNQDSSVQIMKESYREDLSGVQKRLHKLEEERKQVVSDKKIAYTEQEKDIQDSLQKQMQFLSNAVDQSTDGIAIVNLDGYLLTVNKTFADIHGYNPKELISKHLSIFYPLSLKDYLETSAPEMKIKGEFKGEAWHVRQDNTMFPATVHKSLIRDKGGNPIGYVMIVNDISQKRKLGKSIPEYEDTEKILINAFTEPAILIDRDGTILELNEKAAQSLGKSYDELLNQSLYDFIPPRLALSNKEMIDKAVKLTKPVFSNEGIGKSKVDTSYCPILNEEGKVVKLAIICREMSGYVKNINAATRQNDSPLRIQGMDSDQDFAEQSVEKKEETFKDFLITKHDQRQGECNFCFEGIISRDPKLWELFEILPSIAESVSTVLIQGESGTGKYLFASAIHNLSPRKNNPFITVNCGALPETLLESEFFGYKAGAFTDARKDKPGRFALAEGGTLFLDEIGDISLAMQVRLLRFLQERVYEPLGSIKSIKADVRIISATNKDLEDLVKKGKFRDDLFYRINVVRLDLPPLRERLEDVPLLITDIINKLNRQNGKKVDGITEEALMCLLSYDFPGNVRELKNIIEGAIVLCKSGKISPKHLPKHLSSSLDIGCASSPMHKMEAAFLMNVLKQNNWNRIKTARQLCMHKTMLFRRIKALGIKIPASKKESNFKSNV
jgi:PAS domain S-box-containing protein